MDADYYLKIGKASDLESAKERIIFRIFEILPGAISWLILISAVFLSWLAPFWAAAFIIIFSFFWLLRTIYFSIHLWSGYKKMERNEKNDWLKEIKNLPQNEYSDWKNIYHLIVMPACKEPLEIIRGSLKSLANCDYPKDKMIVVIAFEQSTGKSVENLAAAIEKEFSSKFFKFLITYHPKGIKGEIQGKGSNETWAAKKAKELIVDPLKIPYEKIIFSSFDIDTCISKGYFSCVSYYYLTAEKPTRTSFQPIPIFINNIWQAPAFSRLIAFSATFWHTMNQEREKKLITFSSHSMSFKSLIDVGFKQTNVVSDDSRIFWQCFLKYNGDYKVEPIYYPVSMDANVAKTFLRTLINLYRQQRRWAYGVGDIPYFLFGFLKNKKIPLKKKISLGVELFEGHISWAVSSIIILLLGWLPIYFGGFEFSRSVVSYSLPQIISRIMMAAMVGVVTSCYISLLILPPRPPEYGRFKYVIFVLSWLVFPFIMIIFVSLPALEAQTRWMLGRYLGFWVTEKIRDPET